MGQYYKPISITKGEYVYSHDYDNGLKLMEHSWQGNYFVNAVEHLISKGGGWYGDKIVWAGDYADDEEGVLIDGEGANLYHIVEKKITPQKKYKRFRFLKNLDTNEFVDLRKVPVTEVYKKFKYRIHPLPLLTCEGNGRGGGDFHKDSKLIGIWARNRVIAQTSKPKNGNEIIFDLIE